jgi:hypothetical protein
MVVAVVPVRVVEVVADQVIDVVPVGHRLVAAARTVLVPGLVTGVAVSGGATVPVGGVHLQRVLVDVVAVRMMQVAIVQVIDVVAMPDRGVAAVLAVLVAVGNVLVVAAVTHRFHLPYPAVSNRDGA